MDAWGFLSVQQSVICLRLSVNTFLSNEFVFFALWIAGLHTVRKQNTKSNSKRRKSINLAIWFSTHGESVKASLMWRTFTGSLLPRSEDIQVLCLFVCFSSYLSLRLLSFQLFSSLDFHPDCVLPCSMGLSFPPFLIVLSSYKMFTLKTQDVINLSILLMFTMLTFGCFMKVSLHRKWC